MLFIASIVLLFPFLSVALPSRTLHAPRAVASLNQAAFEEAQQRDDTATRLFSGTTIKTTTGQCLSVDELSGDFRANLTPVLSAPCNGTDGQKWDVITAGKHIDAPNAMLVVSSLTQACLNFDPRRAAGNQVILFSCGGRADGGGSVTNSQEFAMNNTANANAMPLQPLNALGTCMTAANGKALDQAACQKGAASQTFTFGG